MRENIICVKAFALVRDCLGTEAVKCVFIPEVAAAKRLYDIVYTDPANDPPANDLPTGKKLKLK